MFFHENVTNKSFEFSSKKIFLDLNLFRDVIR